MTLHPRLLDVFAAWEARTVRWCFLRPPCRPAAPDGDLDLLVHPDDLGPARRAAQDLDFVIPPRNGTGTHLVAFDRLSGRWLWLHCVTSLDFGPGRGLRTGAEIPCLTRREPDPWRLAKPDEFWVTLLHCLLDRRDFPAHHRRRLSLLAACATRESELPAAIRPLLPGEWTAEELIQAAGRAEWGRLVALTTPLAAACRRRRPPLPNRLTRVIRRLPERARTARAQRGVSVALLGPDGAGKSTLAEGLRTSMPLPVKEVYMGLTGGWLRHVDRLRVPGVVRVGRLLVIWGRYLRGTYHQARGRTVVFDRYIYDADIPPPYPLGRFGRFARWIDGRACPGPDLVVVLDAPGAVMHQRKGEYDPGTLEHWRQRFLALRRRVRHLVVVDTVGGPETVRREVTGLIWDRYRDRWRGSER